MKGHKSDNENIQEFQKSNVSIIIYILITCLMAIFAIVGIMLISKDYTNNVEKERKKYLTEIADKNSQLTDFSIESKWKYTNSFKNVIVREHINSEKKLLKTIDEVSKRIDINDVELIVMDNKGNYYGQNNLKGSITKGTEAKRYDSYNKDEFVIIKGIEELNNEVYIIFINKLTQNVKIDDERELLYVGYAQKMDRFIKTFQIGNDSKKSDMAIVNNNNEIIYLRDNIDTIEKKKEKKCLGDIIFNFHTKDISNLEEFYKSIDKSESATVELKYLDDSSYYLLNTPIDIKGWSVIHLIPKSEITENVNTIDKFRSYVITVIIVATILFLIVITYVKMLLRRFAHVIGIQDDANNLLQKVADDANAANKAKSDFLSHMSHDIRTPINGIQGMVDIARKNIDNKEKLTDCLYKIQMSSGYLVSLVNDVLDMSRIETGKLVIKKEPMDIEELYNQCVAIIETQALENNIHFIYSLENVKHKNVYGDSLHIKQILINILGNAIKFTPKDGTVSFTIMENSFIDNVVNYEFVIEDNGIGMSKEYQEKIYEPFSQELDGSRTVYKGTGLGMAIAKEYIDKMDGTIELTSQINKGSKFVVQLSFAVCNEHNPSEDGEQEKSLNDINVLVVEDNDINQEIMVSILEEYGARVQVASNGKEAVDILDKSHQGDIDIVLMDIMMPIMNGYEATNIIKSSKKDYISNLPVVAMSANAYEEDIKKSLDAGMSAHLSKPIDKKEVYRVIKTYTK